MHLRSMSFVGAGAPENPAHPAGGKKSRPPPDTLLSTPAPPPDDRYDHGPLGLDRDVQRGLNLLLRLQNPAQMPALLATIQASKPAIYEALTALRYVHFARFLPTRDMSTLQVITVFDGDLRSYVMDFVALLGDVFTAMLQFVEGAPRLPVKEYPEDFWAWVQDNNFSQVQPWSAYPSLTVIDIITSTSSR